MRQVIFSLKKRNDELVNQLLLLQKELQREEAESPIDL
jgi:hypothetical protein